MNSTRKSWKHQYHPEGRNLHDGGKTGFKLIFPTTFQEEPKQIKSGKEDAEWPIISANHDNVFMTTS